MKSNKQINFYMVRHGKTTKADNDLERVLTTEGENQAGAMSIKLANIEFAAAYVSPAMRTVQTADIIDRTVNTEKIPELYLLDEKIAVMSKDLGTPVEGNMTYPPLEAWLAHEHGDHLNNFGINAAKAIQERINQLSETELNILIVGHAVLLNAMALHLAETEHNKTFILRTPLQEAECLLLSYDETESGLILPNN